VALRRKNKRSHNRIPFLPPEFHYLAQNYQEKTQSEQPLVTAAYEVYQCGQLSWMLAAGWASTASNALSLKEDFTEYRIQGMEAHGLDWTRCHAFQQRSLHGFKESSTHAVRKSMCAYPARISSRCFRP
jgi:hypothetical protein